LGSYLLIGFWFYKPAASEDPEYQRLKGAGARGVLEHRLSPAHAQLKAFVMNRVGDAGFLIGIGALLAAAIARGGAGEPLTWTNPPLAGGGGRPRRRVPRLRRTCVAHARRARHLLRRRRQERAVPAARVAPGRDAGADHRVVDHPRGDHGRRRRLPG